MNWHDDFTPATWSGIESRRAARVDGKLFIDLLLELAGLHSVYPPDSSDALQTLLGQAVDNCYFDTLKRNCLRFYILLDVSKESATAHAQSCFIPQPFQHVTQGYWHADRNEWDSAVVSFCKPGVTPDFLPYLIANLCRHAPKQLATFVHFASPPIHSYSEIACLVEAYAQVQDVRAAWKCARRTIDPKPIVLQEGNSREDSSMSIELTAAEIAADRPIPVEEHITTILNILFGGTSSGTKPNAIRTLLTLPFTPEEDAAVTSFAQDPPLSISAANKQTLLEFVVSRLGAEGRYIEAYQILTAASTQGLSSEASRRRALLKKGLKSVMSNLDLSLIQVAALDMDADANEDDGVLVEKPYQVDIAQHPWAPLIAEDSLELPMAQSLPQAEKQASIRSSLSQHTAPAERDMPLSASPSLRSPARKFAGSQSAIKNVLLATIKASSSSNLKTLAEEGAPRSSPVRTPRQSGAGSPFVRPARVSDSPLHSINLSRQGSPAPSVSSLATDRIKVPRVKPTKLHLLEDQNADANTSAAVDGQPEVHVPFVRDQSVKAKEKVEAPQPLQSTPPRKRLAEPQSFIASPKIQAIETVGTQEGSWFQLTPRKNVSTFPGQFHTSSDDEDVFDPHEPIIPKLAGDVESRDHLPEMREVNRSPVTTTTRRATDSADKPRGERAQAPEPPTPRRSRRLASRDPSADSDVLAASTTSSRASRGRGRGSRRVRAT